MKVLLVGLGRMGLRHVRALARVKAEVVAVDPFPSTWDSGRALLPGIVTVGSLEEALKDGRFDAAILSETADSRLKNFERVVLAGIPNILLEKPLCRSRQALAHMMSLAERNQSRVSVHLYRRTLAAFQPIRERRTAKAESAPLYLSVTSGATGFGCVGIHWIDFALFLTASQKGRLIFSELSPVSIASGRGPQFNDLGGTAIFGFPCGSRLHLTILAASSTPSVATISEGHHLTIIDQEADHVAFYDREAASQKAVYLYGQDYSRRQDTGIENFDLANSSYAWLTAAREGQPSPLPSLAEARIAHDLLFDLLETSGQTEFSFT